MKKGRRQWVKLWVNEWLDGTTRFELTERQRLLWVDLLALAGRSRFPGTIYAGDGKDGRIGYPLMWIAGTLGMEVTDFSNALTVLEVHNHVSVERQHESVIISILNWEKYQSEYLRQKTYRKVNPDKIKARDLVNKAIAGGSLVRPSRCAHCGKECKQIEAHHHRGYSEANALDVLWLCLDCHRKVTTKTPQRLLVEGEGEDTYMHTSVRTWPSGLQLTDRMRAFAVGEGVANPEAEFAAWRDDCAAHKRKYSDWDAAWRTRCRNYVKFAGNGNGRPKPAGPSLEEQAQAILDKYKVRT